MDIKSENPKFSRRWQLIVYGYHFYYRLMIVPSPGASRKVILIYCNRKKDEVFENILEMVLASDMI